MGVGGVKRAFKYRFYPTVEQADQLSRTFGCVRLVYNKALEERDRVHASESGPMTYGQAEPLDIMWSRPLPRGADPSTVTVSRDAAHR